MVVQTSTQTMHNRKNTTVFATNKALPLYCGPVRLLTFRFIVIYFDRCYFTKVLVLLCLHLNSNITSIVTSVTEVRSASARLFASTWHPLVSVITTRFVAICLLQLFFIVKCGIANLVCAIRVFEVQASSWLPLCQILFLSRPPLLS